MATARWQRGDSASCARPATAADRRPRPATASSIERHLKASDFWDEHSLDAQRANTMACLVFGSDEKQFAALAEYIPEDRRVRCADEWKQAFDSWDQLLTPYIKD